MRLFRKALAVVAATLCSYSIAEACTNFIVTRGASTDGSIMVTYAADSHALYGALYHTQAARFKAGAMLPIFEWDTQRYLGDIPQVSQTYSTIGNMNEHSLIIGETTYGGRAELSDTTGRIDYGSLIYVTLQRAKTAREAIQTIADLANAHGYMSSGESFSIADTKEAWIMELIGKGMDFDADGNNKDKGIVWVARRIPDGYVSGHANQARITTFPLNDPENCLYSEDVITFARRKGYFEGEDKDFSFADAYAPLDFLGLRACEARVWSFFRTVADDMDKYVDYAMGYNKENRMPLWVKPSQKVSPKVLFDAMRDHYEGTPMDMTKDVGAGGNGSPIRWGSLLFEVDGKEYCMERPVATRQTGFWFAAQARPEKGDDMGIIWFGVDDAATSCLTPIYAVSNEVPTSYSEKAGSMLRYSEDAAFWTFNKVANFAYMNYDTVSPDVRMVADSWENERLAEVENIDAKAATLSEKKRAKYLTSYSVERAEELKARWSKLYGYLMTKHMDGNLKKEQGSVIDYLDTNVGSKHFIDNGNGADVPEVSASGYSEEWLRKVAKDHGQILQAAE